MNDLELLKAISEKNKDAFGQLYDAYHKALFAKAYHRIKNVEQAEEIMQNFWIDVWEKTEKFKCDEQGNAMGFLSHYLFFRILDYIRKESINIITLANEESFQQFEESLSYSHVSEEYDIKELDWVIQSILQEFPGKMAEIFMLHHKEGHTLKETAKILNLNERTVRYKSKECIAVLKKMLENHENITSFKIVKDSSASIVYIVVLLKNIYS